MSATSKIVDLTWLRIVVKLEEKPGNVAAMNLVPDLLPVVTIDCVFASTDGTQYYVCQITMEFHGGMLGIGESMMTRRVVLSG